MILKSKMLFMLLAAIFIVCIFVPGAFAMDAEQTIVYWENYDSGLRYLWFYEGVELVEMGGIGSFGAEDWRIVDAGDMDGDGRLDILWHNKESGLVYLWLMDGTSYLGGQGVGIVDDSDWVPVALADMNNNDNLDIVWQNSANGRRAIWYMDGVQFTGKTTLFAEDREDPSWEIAAVADLSGDGNPDLVWEDRDTGQREVWFMEGLTKVGSDTYLENISPSWTIAAVVDFNGNGQQDSVWQNLDPEDSDFGLRYVWFMEDLTLIEGMGLGEIPDLNWNLAAVVAGFAAEDLNVNLEVGKMMDDFIFNKDLVNQYYDEGVQQIGSVDYVSGIDGQFALKGQAMLDSVPQEFLESIPHDGFIPAPPGACPAAAEPEVSFVTRGNEIVTPDLLEGKKAFPASIVMAPPGDPDSLANIIQGKLDWTDQALMGQLTEPAGWNNLLWSQLEQYQVQLESLMDYHLWVVAEDIEEQAVAELRLQLETLFHTNPNIPEEFAPLALSAFDDSEKTGWFANSRADAGDAFDRMDIVAEMTGNISGTVYEERQFSIPGAGQEAVFGVQTGYGEIIFEHPELGELVFDVSIELDEFDDQGRAIAGSVDTVEKEHGYRCLFIFQDDGTKEGELYLNDDLIGKLTMTVDAEKFENYVDIDLETGAETIIPL